jgi:hypothetical protein
VWAWRARNSPSPQRAGETYITDGALLVNLRLEILKNELVNHFVGGCGCRESSQRLKVCLEGVVLEMSYVKSLKVEKVMACPTAKNTIYTRMRQ